MRSATGASGGRVRAAAAGAVAALVWGLQEPLDRRAFRSDYSDVAVLGKALFRGRGWRAVGFASPTGSTDFLLARNPLRL